MTLFEKIKSIYPSLTNDDFSPIGGVILLQNNLDGNGEYIAKWEHPILVKPENDQLNIG